MVLMGVGDQHVLQFLQVPEPVRLGIGIRPQVHQHIRADPEHGTGAHVPAAVGPGVLAEVAAAEGVGNPLRRAGSVKKRSVHGFLLCAYSG